MNMPFMDGVELCAELRRQGLTQPFLLITGDEAAPLKLAHPEIDVIMTKDEHLQETLPELLVALLSGQ
jgi:CheY-like chemotaxis protein